MIDFIEHSFCKNELVYALLSSLKLEGTEPLSLKEYLSLLQEMFSKKTHSLKESYDSLYLLNYNQPYSELLQAKYVYCLGLNETIIPQEFKNTNLLLNQEALALKYPTTYDALNKHQNTLRHLFLVIIKNHFKLCIKRFKWWRFGCFIDYSKINEIIYDTNF